MIEIYLPISTSALKPRPRKRAQWRTQDVALRQPWNQNLEQPSYTYLYICNIYIYIYIYLFIYLFIYLSIFTSTCRIKHIYTYMHVYTYMLHLFWDVFDGWPRHETKYVASWVHTAEKYHPHNWVDPTYFRGKWSPNPFLAGSMFIWETVSFGTNHSWNSFPKLASLALGNRPVDSQ